MRSMPASSWANLPGKRKSPSRPGSIAPCSGTWKTRIGGARCGNNPIPVNVSDCWPPWRREVCVHVVVTGAKGQLARALAEYGPAHRIRVTAIGRPHFDLCRPETVAQAIAPLQPDVIVNAAAYTAVDQAEREPDLAQRINAAGAGAVAQCAAGLGIPIVQLSTDYVFDGRKPAPYVEQDVLAPLGAYGASKAAGERAVRAATSDHAILRTAWLYSPFGGNFVATMLRLARSNSRIRVVADQSGSPSYALDLADGIFKVARNLLERPSEPALRGVFHMAGSGRTTWAEFAGAIFELAARRGGPAASVEPITTADYRSLAVRPANSCLNCDKLARVHQVVLPPWRASLAAYIGRLFPEGQAAHMAQP